MKKEDIPDWMLFFLRVIETKDNGPRR